MLRAGAGVAAVQRVDLDEAHRIFDRREATFVDVRHGEDYDASHIPAALSIPLADIARRTVEIPRDQKVILY